MDKIERYEFIEKMKMRSKRFALDVIFTCRNLPKTIDANILARQLIKSATSQAANYRAACRARSKAEFFSKLSIVVEETDESSFWLELLLEAQLISQQNYEKLYNESEELLKIYSTARKNTYKK